jgi:hypothetical protein
VIRPARIFVDDGAASQQVISRGSHAAFALLTVA